MNRGRFTLLSLFLYLLVIQCVNAHLIPSGNGAIEVKDRKVSFLIGVPVSVIAEFDQNHNGFLDYEEMQQKEEIFAKLNTVFKFTSRNESVNITRQELFASPIKDQSSTAPQFEWLVQYVLPELVAQSLPLSIEIDRAFLSTNYNIQLTYGNISEATIITYSHPKHIFLQSAWSTLLDYFSYGFEHILNGYDHILFLLTLLSSGLRKRRWLLLLTSFTLAHGMTYGLSSLGVVSISPNIVEPLIAFTIVMVGAMKLVNIQLELSQECLLIFCFGLIHGLGFASAMSNNLEGIKQFPLETILGFNLGVEAGQLFVALCLFVFLYFFEIKKRVRMAISVPTLFALIASVLGLYWLIQRIFFLE